MTIKKLEFMTIRVIFKLILMFGVVVNVAFQNNFYFKKY